MSESLDIKMARIEEGFKNIDNKLDVHIADQKEQFEDMKKLIDNFICSSEEKFAPRWVASVIIWAGTIVGGAMLIGLVTLTYRLILHVGEL